MKITQKIKKGILTLAATLLLAGCANSKKFMSVEAYRDTRGMYAATLTGGAKNLPFGTDLFGFVDIETEKHNQDNLKRPYGEVRLSKKIENGLGVAVEHNRNFALSKGITRTGLVFEPNLKKLDKDLFLGVKYFPTSTDNHGSQLGIYGEKSFNNKDFYIGGYFDYNFKPNKIVTDIQFGKKIKENLYFVIEGRLNEFRKDKKGLSLGLKYNF